MVGEGQEGRSEAGAAGEEAKRPRAGVSEVSGEDGVSGAVPSLDISVTDSAKGKVSCWNRLQKAVYRDAQSWCKEALSRECQLLWVMLSSSAESTERNIMRDFQELRRRIEKAHGYYVEYFNVHTSEGNGVLHQIWGIRQRRAVWIDQSWLSEQWASIHGSPVVWIARIKSGKYDVQRVVKYFVNQYLAGQVKIIRHTYSWWRCKVALGKEWNVYRREMWKMGMHWVKRDRFFACWDRLITFGSVTIGSLFFYVEGRNVYVVSTDGGYPQNGRKEERWAGRKMARESFDLYLSGKREWEAR